MAQLKLFLLGGARLEQVAVPSSSSIEGKLTAPLAAGIYDVLVRRGDREAIAPEAFTVQRQGGRVADDCRATPGRGGDFPALWLLLMGLIAARRRR